MHNFYSGLFESRNLLKQFHMILIVEFIASFYGWYFIFYEHLTIIYKVVIHHCSIVADAMCANKVRKSLCSYEGYLNCIIHWYEVLKCCMFNWEVLTRKTAKKIGHIFCKSMLSFHILGAISYLKFFTFYYTTNWSPTNTSLSICDTCSSLEIECWSAHSSAHIPIAKSLYTSHRPSLSIPSISESCPNRDPFLHELTFQKKKNFSIWWIEISQQISSSIWHTLKECYNYIKKKFTIFPFTNKEWTTAYPQKISPNYKTCSCITKKTTKEKNEN